MPLGTTFGTLQRITLITDESLEKMLLDKARALGADNYVCSYCSGKPLHVAVEDPRRMGSLVRIELLAQAEAAQAILEYVNHLLVRNYPLTVLMDSVMALPLAALDGGLNLTRN